MGYDFVVGDSRLAKASAAVVARVELKELAALGLLRKRVGSSFLDQVSNAFDDATFTPPEVDRTIKELHPLLLDELGEGERAMLYKLLAVLSYASAKKQILFGVAD